MNKLFYKIPEISNTLFGSDVKLLPSVDELFELELANLEYHILDKDELIERSAFSQVCKQKIRPIISYFFESFDSFEFCKRNFILC